MTFRSNHFDTNVARTQNREGAYCCLAPRPHPEHRSRSAAKASGQVGHIGPPKARFDTHAFPKLRHPVLGCEIRNIDPRRLRGRHHGFGAGRGIGAGHKIGAGHEIAGIGASCSIGTGQGVGASTGLRAGHGSAELMRSCHGCMPAKVLRLAQVIATAQVLGSWQVAGSGSVGLAQVMRSGQACPPPRGV